MKWLRWKRKSWRHSYNSLFPQVQSTRSSCRFSTSPPSPSQKMFCQPLFIITLETFKTAPRPAPGPRAVGATAPGGTATSTWSSGVSPPWITRWGLLDTFGSMCLPSTGISYLGSGRTSLVWSTRPRTMTSCSLGLMWPHKGPSRGRSSCQTAHLTSWSTPMTLPFQSLKVW